MPAQRGVPPPNGFEPSEDQKLYLSTLERTMRQTSTWSALRSQLRPSSFPVCSRFVALHKIWEKAYGSVYAMSDFSSHTYFSAGHAGHEVWQNWMGRAGMLYGHWSCPTVLKKERVGNVETRHYCGYKVTQWGSMECPQCKRAWLEYDEFNLVEMGKNLGLSSAHTDGLVYVPPPGEPHPAFPIPADSDLKPNAVLELKTTSNDDYKYRKKNNMVKSGSHIAQASTYLRGVEKEVGLPMRYILYGYINRNHPWQIAWVLIEPDRTDHLLINAAQYHFGKGVLKHGIMPKGSCQTEEDAKGFSWYGKDWMECPFRKTCFGRNGLDSGGSPPWLEQALVQIQG